MPDVSPGYGILLLLGIGVFGGMLGAWLFQRLRIPQVIGYIAIGLLLGDSGFGVIALPDLVIWVWACSRRAVSPSVSR